MKIEHVELFYLSMPNVQNIGDGSQDALVVKVVSGDLVGWGEYTLDERFAGKVILPGFVEGHCHSWEGAAWEDVFLGFLDRTSPTREVHRGLKTIEEVVTK